MAGAGTCPFQFSSHMSRLQSVSYSMNVSLFVNRRDASNESCTIPITGLLACGETMLRGTDMISLISARGSWPCTRCMFISSPSKSALYGEVTDKLSLKVEYGRMRTRWPIMDILCSDG